MEDDATLDAAAAETGIPRDRLRRSPAARPGVLIEDEFGVYGRLYPPLGFRERRNAELKYRAVTAFQHHELRDQSNGRFFLSRRRRDGRLDSHMAVEILLGFYPVIYVGGDIDTCTFAYGPRDHRARIAWMGAHTDVSYYVAQKAGIGSGSKTKVFSSEAAREDIRDLLQDRIVELKELDEDPDSDSTVEGLRGLLELADCDQDHLLRELWRLGFEDYNLGEVLDPKVYFAWAAIRRLHFLLGPMENEKMKVDGYKIQHTIRELEARRKLLASQFTDALVQFDDEDKGDPRTFMEEYSRTERKIAQLQVLQARYNLTVHIEVAGTQMTLHEAVKAVGGRGRVEKMWRTATNPTHKTDRYAYRPLTRSKDEITAGAVIPASEALKEVVASGRIASAYRAAISKGNATEVEFQDLDASLFE